MTKEQSAIGIFDSGIGGLTALRKLAEMLPAENLIYLGDTARVPYGNRSPETICLYAEQCAGFLLEHEVKAILVACNTVSAVALSVIEQLASVPVIGVIKPAVQAALNLTTSGRIGIIGTRATIKSQAYETEFNLIGSGNTLTISSIACPLFVPIVEEGWHEHPAAYEIAQEYLNPLIDSKIDTLILGCTHYPLLKKIILEIMPNVTLIDSGEEAAKAMTQMLVQTHLPMELPEHDRSIRCYVTDPTASSTLRLVQDIFGLPSDTVQHASIDHIFKKPKLSTDIKDEPLSESNKSI